MIKLWTLLDKLLGGDLLYPFIGCFSTKFPSGTTGKKYLPLYFLSIIFLLAECPSKYKNQRNLNLEKEKQKEKKTKENKRKGAEAIFTLSLLIPARVICWQS